MLDSAERDAVRLLATIGLLLTALLLILFAKPMLAYAQATATQLLDVELYRQAILGGGA
ncbi:hypothetical protein D9M71_542590 [compost metagenome]